jgi:hypothetical protein
MASRMALPNIIAARENDSKHQGAAASQPPFYLVRRPGGRRSLASTALPLIETAASDALAL